MKVIVKKAILFSSIILVFILIVLGFVEIIQNFISKKVYKIEFEQYVIKYSEINKVDKYLIFAIIKAESNFKIKTESRSGAIGLMQLMEETAYEEANFLNYEIKNIEELYYPENNIKLGTAYIAKLIKKYDGNYNLALAAYNAGIGNVDKWIEKGILKKDGSDIENIPFKETNNYVRKVRKKLKNL